MKTSVNKLEDSTNNLNESNEMNQVKLVEHDDQIDDIWKEMKNRQQQMEKQINENKELDFKEKKIMKDEIYCQLVEETKETIEQIRKTGGKGLEERISERMMKLENEMKLLTNIKNEIKESKSKEVI
jgi:hypothetical protein